MASDPNPRLMTIGQAVKILSRDFPDVSVSSLRFLEREGLLAPQRKPGGHRLYTQHDVERARRIKQWQSERMSLREIGERLNRASQASDLDTVVTEMTSYLLAGYLWPAMDMLKDVYESGVPLLDVCNHVLTPVLRNLGDDQGNHLIPVDVQLELDEYLISFFAKITPDPGSTAGTPVVVAACPPWERHDMPLRMLAAMLAERGASVHFIGAQVDGEFVRDAIARVQPDRVLISLTVRPPGKAVAWFMDVIASMNDNQRLVIGGMGSTHLPPFEEANVEVVGLMSYADIIERLFAGNDSAAGEG